MDALSAINSEDENTRERAYLQYQAFVHADSQQRHPEQIKQTGRAENGANTEDEENSADDRKSPSDEWVRNGNPQGSGNALYTKTGLASQRVGQSNERAGNPNGPQSTEEDKDLVRRLQARDREVRQHEQAHSAALGQYAGSVQYTYQIGPDGHAYAVGGSTEVRAAGGGTPEQQQARARTIRSAAMAASDPSSADMSVAADAQRSEQEAAARIQTRGTAPFGTPPASR